MPTDDASGPEGPNGPDETDGTDGPEAAEVEAALDLLRRLTAARGINLYEIDDKLGHARGYTSRLLAGRKRLTYELLLRFLRVIEVDPDLYFSTLYPPRGRREDPPLPPKMPPRRRPAVFRRPDVAGLRTLLGQLLASLPEVAEQEDEEEAPRSDVDLETRILAAVREILAEERPRRPQT